MYIIVMLFFAFIILLLIWYFFKARVSSEGDYPASMTLPQDVKAERRQHPRTDVNWVVSMETPDGKIKARVTNISVGGAFVSCGKPLPVGEIFDLTMIGPENEPIAATAQVVWTNVNVPAEKVVNLGMGVRFIHMSDRHIQLVRRFLRENDELANKH